MYTKKFVIPVLLILVLAIGCAGYAFSERMLSDQMPADDIKEIYGRIGVTRQKNRAYPSSFASFDVNEEGLVMIVFDDRVEVYDDRFSYLYGYTFNDSLGRYGQWENGEIAIYNIRGHFVFTINRNAECTGMRSIGSDSPKGDDEYYWLYTVPRATKEVGGEKYVIRNYMVIGFSRTRLDSIDEEGNVRIIYDATLEHSILVLTVICIALAVAFAVGGVVYNNYKDRAK